MHLFIVCLLMKNFRCHVKVAASPPVRSNSSSWFTDTLERIKHFGIIQGLCIMLQVGAKMWPYNVHCVASLPMSQYAGRHLPVS